MRVTCTSLVPVTAPCTFSVQGVQQGGKRAALLISELRAHMHLLAATHQNILTHHDAKDDL
eukprot:1140453-Pelagomonas_calceolata.AAC.4